MLGDSVNSFSNVDLDRFYLSTIAGRYPIEHNAFDVTRKLCHTRRLREVQAADEVIRIQSNVIESNVVESNVIGIFSRKEMARSEERANIFAPHRRNLAWQVHYLREVESA
ncbi:hypothetical protein BH10CYA1_BH10CYA1_40060 [soil metagenome]